MIETHELTKEYRELIAVDHVSMEVRRGDVYGFIGPNGAGKTTTMRMLATLLSPTGGSATVCGYKIPGQSKDIRKHIGYMPDFFGIYEDMKVNEYLDFFASAYRISGAERKRIVRDVLALTDLTAKANTVIGTLSRGVQQRLGLSRVLIHDPEVLLLDEPASGLDPRARIEIRELIRELQSMGKTILISSHILQELGEICNRIGIIEKGKLVFQGDLAEVMEESRVRGTHYVVVEGDLEPARKVLAAHENIEEATIDCERIKIKLTDDTIDTSFITSLLIDNNFGITHLKEEEVNLEDVFMKLTKGLVQ